MKKSIIRVVFFVGAISVICTLIIQSYWVISTWDINDREFNNKVNLALNSVANEIAALKDITVPVAEKVKRQTSNYFIVSVEAEIDIKVLELYLKEAFENNQLNIDFEYAIFDCNTDQMIYGNYCKYSPDSKPDPPLGDLPVYEGETSAYYFGVKFPSLPGYLFDKMQLSVFFSLILLFTTSFFTYAMFVIFRQNRLSELQKDFINNMTHEFKTPLSTIKISADVFLTNPLIQKDDRLLNYAKIIKEQNERLNRQVEEVLQVAKIERGLNLKLEEISIQKIWKNLVQDAEMKVEKLNGTVTESHFEDDVQIMADRLHLNNILFSILDNAIKYHRGTPQIDLSLKKEPDNCLSLTISDKGIGIPKEYQQRVFEKFFRIPTGNVHNVKGFGLGLFYVKKICDTHNWKLFLKSEINQGTSVKILIHTIIL